MSEVGCATDDRLRVPAQTTPLRGELRLPGDKSISHRALIFSALAEGESTLEGLSTGADVASTREALRSLGVSITGTPPGPLHLRGVGVGGLRPPIGGAPIACGNSGTTVRLLAGAVAQGPGRFVFVGDASLSKRPMERVAAPLRAMGAKVTTGEGGGLPLLVEGPVTRPVAHASAVASAQIKSCVLLAGLAAPGETVFEAPASSRDHSERMLRAMGCAVEASQEGRRVAVEGPVGALAPLAIAVPGDPSSAAFLVAAAALIPGSAVTITGLCVNPGRTHYLEVLRAMGVDLSMELADGAEEGCEPVGRVRVRASELCAIDVPADVLPAIIDEVPILAVVAAFARGRSHFHGVGELRHKESDRLAGILALLSKAGVEAGVESRPGAADPCTLWVQGGAPGPPGLIETPMQALGDHRLAMAGVVLALACGGGEIDGASSVSISYPGFTTDLKSLGAKIS